MKSSRRPSQRSISVFMNVSKPRLLLSRVILGGGSLVIATTPMPGSAFIGSHTHNDFTSGDEVLAQALTSSQGPPAKQLRPNYFVPGYVDAMDDFRNRPQTKREAALSKKFGCADVEAIIQMENYNRGCDIGMSPVAPRRKRNFGSQRNRSLPALHHGGIIPAEVNATKLIAELDMVAARYAEYEKEVAVTGDTLSDRIGDYIDSSRSLRNGIRPRDRASPYRDSHQPFVIHRPTVIAADATDGTRHRGVARVHDESNSKSQTALSDGINSAGSSRISSVKTSLRRYISSRWMKVRNSRLLRCFGLKKQMKFV